MNSIEMVKAHISNSISVKHLLLEHCCHAVAAAADLLVTCLSQGNKVLCCGNGGSASDAQHFAAELLGRYVSERRSLAAIALNTDTSTLTAIANDYGYQYVFARQIEGLGNSGDLLLAITTSGNSENIIEAVKVAHTRGMRVIALTGKNGGKLTQCLNADDVNICAPGNVTSHIQESHITVIHCLCEMLENM